MMQWHDLPLFPLGSTLLPGGRMRLQVFEPRYVSLVSRCLREQSTFGVVLIQHGREVRLTAQEALPTISQVGTEARIIDFEALPNGLLGITIQGERRFDVHTVASGEQGLVQAQISWRAGAPALAIPPEAEHLRGVLAALAEHPMLKQMGLRAEVHDVDALGFALAQCLPLPECERQALLCDDSPMGRLARIGELVREMGG